MPGTAHPVPAILGINNMAMLLNDPRARGKQQFDPSAMLGGTKTFQPQGPLGMQPPMTPAGDPFYQPPMRDTFAPIVKGAEDRALESEQEWDALQNRNKRQQTGFLSLLSMLNPFRNATFRGQNIFQPSPQQQFGQQFSGGSPWAGTASRMNPGTDPSKMNRGVWTR